MTASAHDTVLRDQVQAALVLGDSWATEVVPRLPAALDAQAQLLRAFLRVRGIQTPSDLLRALLALVLSGCSLRGLGAWATLIDLASLSDVAWGNRLEAASPWLLWLSGTLLAASVATAPLPLATPRIRLVDTTRFRAVGGTGDDQRLHLAYDFVAGRMDAVSITDRHTAESLAWLTLTPHEIIVADAGYGYRRNIALLHAAQADGVLRVYLPTFPLETDDGVPFDAVAWLRQQQAAVVEWQGYCRYQRQRYRVRLVASKLPPEQRSAAERRSRTRASRKQRRVSAQRLLLAGWQVLITTLHDGERWPAAEVLRLYRARWQIELVFKRIKTLIATQVIPYRRAARVEAAVRALVVAWALQAQQSGEVQALLDGLGGASTRVVSSWQVIALSVTTLRGQVLGEWDMARVRACLPQLQRYLSSRRRTRRPQQEGTLRAWLLARGGGQAMPAAVP
jgi:hypothetical protein